MDIYFHLCIIFQFSIENSKVVIRALENKKCEGYLEILNWVSNHSLLILLTQSDGWIEIIRRVLIFELLLFLCCLEQQAFSKGEITSRACHRCDSFVTVNYFGKSSSNPASGDNLENKALNCWVWPTLLCLSAYCYCWALWITQNLLEKL